MPRYSDLIAQIPTGTFYSSQGSVVSNLDHPYPMRIDTKVPSDTFGVFVNNVYQFEIITDVDGIAIFNVSLPKGENIVKLVNLMTQRPIVTYISVRDWATWLTAYADQLTNFDVEIDTVKRNSRLAEVNYEMADPVWGARLLTNDSPAYPIDTYREVLQQVQQGYRRFGGITGGLDEVVAAFTQVNPWMCTTQFGPRWVLGTDFIDNSRLEGYPNALLANPWPDIDPIHPGNVSITYNQPFYSVTTINPMTLEWNSGSRRFTYYDGSPPPIGGVVNVVESGYVPPTGTFSQTLEARPSTPLPNLNPWLIAGYYSKGDNVIYEGRYYTSKFGAPWPAPGNIGNTPVPGGTDMWLDATNLNAWKSVALVYGALGPYDTTTFNWIAIDLGLGPLNIQLTVGAAVPASTIATDITAAMSADSRYAPSSIGVFTFDGPYLQYYGYQTLVLVPPIDPTTGFAVGDAAHIIWGVPWIQTSVSVAATSLPPTNPLVTLAVVNAANFPTPNYPGAYSVDVIYTNATPTRLTLPVTAVDKGANTITVDFAAYLGLPAGQISIGALVYPTTQTNYQTRGVPVMSKLTINVADTSLLPLIPSAPYTVTVSNNFTVMPDAQFVPQHYPTNPIVITPQLGVAPTGWVNSAASDTNVVLSTVDGPLSRSTLVMETLNNTANWTLTTHVNHALKGWEGFIGEFGVWVGRDRDKTGVAVGIQIVLSFIKDTYVYDPLYNGPGHLVPTPSVVSSYTRLASVAAGRVEPFQIGTGHGTGDVVVVPPADLWDYATLSISATGSNLNGVRVRIDSAYLKMWTHTGLNLGFNTIPRSAKRADHGYMLYTWCPDPVSAAEDALLGLPQFVVDPPYVVSLADLRAIVITPSFGAQTYAVSDTGTIYQFSPDTGANDIDNGNTIIKPNNVDVASNGRWLLVVYPTGHISTVSPTQVTIDRFDIDDGTNLKGVFTDLDFFACGPYGGADYISAVGYCNLDVVSRAPSRFSYLAPPTVSTVSAPVMPQINLAPLPNIANDYTIALPHVWDQNLNTIVLFEDQHDGRGPIPLPHGEYPYPTGVPGISDLGLLANVSILGVNGLTNPGVSTYSIEYQRLTQLTTPVMELPAAYQNYQWWADWVTFRMLNMVPQSVSIYTGLQFDGNFVATLNVRTNLDISQSLLLRNTGTRVVPVPATQWSYLNANTLRLSPQAFDAASTYTLQYIGRVIQPLPIPQVTVEIRQGKLAADVAAADWQVLPHYNQVVKTVLDEFVPMPTNVFPFFQMRMSISNITDIRFFRLYSMMLKGIPVNWWGNSAIVPHP